VSVCNLSHNVLCFISTTMFLRSVSTMWKFAHWDVLVSQNCT